MDVKLEDFERYRGRLKRYSSGLIHQRSIKSGTFFDSHANREDIVQEAYIVFHNKLPSLKIESEQHLFNTLKSYLFNTYRKFYNVKSSHIKLSKSYDRSFDWSWYDENVGESRNDNSLSDKYEIFLNSLSDAQKESLTMVCDGWKKFEVAKELGLSRQAINHRFNLIKIKYENKVKKVKE